MKYRLVLAFCVIINAFFGVGRATATIFRVDSTSTATNPDGSAWDHTYCFRYLQDALYAASLSTGPHTIRVAQGVYHPDEGANQPSDPRDASFGMLSDVTILGGYWGIAGGGNSDDQNPSVFVTILSGDLAGNDAAWPSASNRGENSKNVVIASNVNDQAILEGVVVTGGDSSDVGYDGAGIWINNASPQIVSCVVQHNRITTDNFGGGIYVRGSSFPQFTNCTIMENQGGTGGGLTVALNADARVDDSQIVSNFADGQGGGGVAVESGANITINNSMISENSFESASVFFDGGGGIVSRDTGNAFLRGCSIADNISTNAVGGGAYVGGASTLTAVVCTFDHNQSLVGADDGGKGGGVYSISGVTNAARIISCTFKNNETDGIDNANGGGGIYFGDRTTGYVVNSVFFGNSAYNGGAIFTFGSFFEINNCTVSQNTAANLGGGLYVARIGSIGHPGELATVNNSIIWNNYSTNGSPEQKQFWTNRIISAGDHPVLLYSDLQDLNTTTSPMLLAGASNIKLDPQFLDAGLHNFHLMACSPAIDSADTTATNQDQVDADQDSFATCSGCTAGERTPDRDLSNRVVAYLFATGSGVTENVCANGCTTTIVDMGAYEFQAPDGCCKVDINKDGARDGRDIQPFVDILLGITGSTCLSGLDLCPADMNSDGIVTMTDVPGFVIGVLAGSPCVSTLTGGYTFIDVDCNGNDQADETDIFTGASQDCNGNGIPDECEIDESSTAEGGPFFCTSDCASDCNNNAIPDECETDCNANSIPDDCDITAETSNDVNSNGIPDECELDCNSNNIPDSWDISEETSEDCNENGVPDECDYDCNGNDIPDDCELDGNDCNENGNLDSCDITLGAPFGSLDCNDNDIPDECELVDNDCNENSIPDECDITSELSTDENENGTPDECEEEMMMRGGGESNFASPEDEAEAWAEFYEWCFEQEWGPTSELSGSDQFNALVAKQLELGLTPGQMCPQSE